MGRLREALAEQGLAAIAEIKRRSPSAGDLRLDADPGKLAASFERSGAAAVSVLVDERFGGSISDLRAARAAAGLPLLAKGFFSTEDELVALRAAGADAVLLLLRDLDDETAARLQARARDLGMDALVEAHDADELARAVAPRRRPDRHQRPRPGDVQHRQAHAARVGRHSAAGSDDRRRERRRDARARRRSRAGRRRRDPRRLRAHAGVRSRCRARVAPRTSSGQGLRAHAPGGRRRGNRGRRRPLRVHPRAGEPAGGRGGARRGRRRSLRRRARRRAEAERRRSRPALRARGGHGPRPRRRAPALRCSASRR